MNENGFAGVPSSFFSVFFEASSDLPAITSSTSFVTSSEGFFDVSLALGAVVVGFAPKENENGDEVEVEPLAGNDGVKPLPTDELEVVALVADVDVCPSNEKPPDGAEGKDTVGLGAAVVVVFRAVEASADDGFQPALVDASSRCILY